MKKVLKTAKFTIFFYITTIPSGQPCVNQEQSRYRDGNAEAGNPAGG